jgi:hypothetical protein
VLISSSNVPFAIEYTNGDLPVYKSFGEKSDNEIFAEFALFSLFMESFQTAKHLPYKK